METLDRNHNSQWPPNSGVIVGRIVDAMDLRVGALSDRTARRYFRGERIKESEQNQILFDLSCVLFDSGIAGLPYALPEEFPLYGYLSGGLVLYATMWGQILGFLRGKPLSIQRTDVASVACLRLSVIDMAIRVAAFLDLAQLPPPSEEVPLWAQEGAGSLFLKKLLQECGDKRPTRDQLADDLEVLRNTVDSWLDGNVTPSRENIENLGKYLNDLLPQGRSESPVCSLRRNYALSSLAARLSDWLGRETVIELAMAFQRLTKWIMESLRQYRHLPLEQWVEHHVGLFVWGSQSVSTQAILRRVISRESDPVWQADLAAAHTRWKNRLHYVFRKIMELESQPGFPVEADLPALNRMLSRSLAYQPSDSTGVDPSAASSASSRIKSPSPSSETFRYHVAMFEQARANGDFEGAIQHAYRASVLNPTDTHIHLKLGEVLGEQGYIQKAMDEFWIAISMEPQWEAPWIAMGAALIDAHRPEEALEILDRAFKELNGTSWDFAYHWGVARLWCGDTQGALEMFEQTLRRKPDHAFAMDLAASCYLELGDRRRGRELSKQSSYLGVSGTHLAFQWGLYNR